MRYPGQAGNVPKKAFLSSATVTDKSQASSSSLSSDNFLCMTTVPCIDVGQEVRKGLGSLQEAGKAVGFH